MELKTKSLFKKIAQKLRPFFEKIMRALKSFFGKIIRIFKGNVRQYTMIAALVVICITFTITTGGIFISPRNLSILFVQMCTTGILTGGMLLVMVSGNIDLSAGSVCGTLGALAAYLMTRSELLKGFGFNPIIEIIVAIIITMIVGLLIGAWHGYWVAFRGVPAFIVTLSSQIAFRGLTLLITNGATIGEFDPGFKAIGQNYIPNGLHMLVGIIFAAIIVLFIASDSKKRKDRVAEGSQVLRMPLHITKLVLIPAALVAAGFIIIKMNIVPDLQIGGFEWRLGNWTVGFNGLTMILFIAAIIVFIIMELKKRQKRIANGFTVLSIPLQILKLVAISAVLAFAGIYIFTFYKGIPYAILILLAVVAFSNITTTRTSFGRHVYAIGGNVEAARLSGVNIKKSLMKVFLIMGAMTGVAAIVYTSRLNAATTAAGANFELDAIAACIIGGTSTSGGSGTAIGAIIGALVMASLDNGMSLMDLPIMIQYIVKGAILLLAVWADTANRKK